MALADVIKKIFGSKADRDYKAVKPILNKILAVYPEIDALSNDELRARSAALRERLREVEAPFEARIAEIREQLGADIPVRRCSASRLLMRRSNLARRRGRATLRICAFTC